MIYEPIDKQSFAFWPFIQSDCYGDETEMVFVK